MRPSNLHIAWARLFAKALAHAGVQHAVISPGSRSTPLVLGLCSEGALQRHSVVDERSAAFFALGIARVTGAPALLVCTSGTAASHYYPAVIEAALARVPLVVISADRPWDAYDCAAPQTVDQVKLFGGYVRHYAELGLPDADAFAAVGRVAVQSVARAMGPDPGPVHINARFRKPLEPQRVELEEPWQPAMDRALRSVTTVLRVEPLEDAPEPPAWLLDEPHVAVAWGPAVGPRASRESLELLDVCARLSVPVLAEATSGARFARSLAASIEPIVLRSIEALVSSKRFGTRGPSAVVELGLPMVSTAYGRWASERGHEVRRVVFSRHGWSDASSNATLVVDGSPVAFFRRWLRAQAQRASSDVRDERARWARAWSAADLRAARVVREELESDALTEGSAIAHSLCEMPDGSTLIVGNSVAVRDVDAYALDSSPPVRVLHQRGASGIDGLVAGALGARVVSESPVLLILGDVSLWHDIGSLQLVQHGAAPLVIVALQNEGGRIFDRLPLGADPSVRGVYEQFFLTDRGRDFEAVSRAFGLAYARVDRASALRQRVNLALRHRGATLIECVCGVDNAARYASLVRRAAAAIDDGP
jgi:2-succinyl-5-enolpyruvyl-6-hydroxy-3-cyclohexene-1-carboxylate synthase